MEASGRPIYKEWSAWPGWLLIMFWGAMFLSMVVVWMRSGGPDGDGFWGVILLAAFCAAAQWLFAGLMVRLYPERIVVGLGSSGWIAKRIPYSEILRTESVTYAPIAEFGGWGVRWGKDGKVAWTARGNHAVVLHLANGTRLYVGSDTPHRLEERIKAVAGNRMGGTVPAGE